MSPAGHPRRLSQRERLMAPFRGLRPDRPAWAVDLTYWYSAIEARDTLPAKYRGRRATAACTRSWAFAATTTSGSQLHQPVGGGRNPHRRGE